MSAHSSKTSKLPRQEAVSDKEFNTLQELKKLLGEADLQSWKAAEIIYKVRERGGYKNLGYDTLESYCEDGIGKSYSAITQLLRAYEVAILQCHFKAEDLPEPSKVYLVAEIMEQHPKQAEEWIEKAHNLSWRDLRNEKKEEKSGILMKDCKHPKAQKIILCMCPDCKLSWREYPEGMIKSIKSEKHE